jgi:hypothetical protein
MDSKQSLNDEFGELNDIFDLDRDIKLAEKLSKQKNLKERTNRNIKEFMENQIKRKKEQE